MKNEIISTRKYRERLLGDPYRPAYHFAICDDLGYSGDPNGCFYVDGIYHLMYLYKNSATNAFHWGHMSSLDLLHWRHHRDALGACYDGDMGYYSGGAFVDSDGTAYISYFKHESKDGSDKGGIGIAYSRPPYDVWEKFERLAVENASDIWGVTDIEIDGEIRHVACADPSNIWKADGRYYMQLGNLFVLDNYGRAENSEEKYKGGWTELFRSEDLRNWEYVGRFYENKKRGADGYPDDTEDAMCPSLLPLFDAEENGNLTGKYLQLFLAHNRGCQYYVGTLDGERFIPEGHGRMSWNDKAFFAPEALVDGKNRQIMWTWLLDNHSQNFSKYGWSGVFGIPRNVWYEDGELKMSPISELELLQYAHISQTEFDGDEVKVNDGALCRIKGAWHGEEKAGVAVRVSNDGKEYTEIYYSPSEKKLIMDTTNSGCDGWRIREEAPFELRDGEELSLDVLIDKSVIEVYANKRQAICRRVYPTDPEISLGVRLIGETPKRIDTYSMFPTNPY